MAFSYQQGYFKPSNPDKYIGDPNNIVYRSSYELRAFNFIDRNQSITHWGSEEFAIPYISPLDSSPHRYFVDLLIQVENKNGKQVYIIEIKPFSQTQKPRKTAKKKEKNYLYEVRQYSVNQSKWAAARAYAKKRGWQFVLWTEKELWNGIDKGFKKKK